MLHLQTFSRVFSNIVNELASLSLLIHASLRWLEKDKLFFPVRDLIYIYQVLFILLLAGINLSALAEFFPYSEKENIHLAIGGEISNCTVL